MEGSSTDVSAFNTLRAVWPKDYSNNIPGTYSAAQGKPGFVRHASATPHRKYEQGDVLAQWLTAEVNVDLPAGCICALCMCIDI